MRQSVGRCRHYLAVTLVAGAMAGALGGCGGRGGNDPSTNRFRIAFVSFRDGDSGYTIYTMNGEGSDVIRLPNDESLEEFRALDPEFSLDGTKITYTSVRSESFDLFAYRPAVMNADGTHRRAAGYSLGGDPTFSPNANAIAYLSSDETSYGIFTINLDGTGRKKIVEFWGGFSGGMPAWSPDGSKIAFAAFKNDGLGNPPEFGDIVLVNPDGSGQVQLTAQGASSPSWSLDGRHIVFTSIPRQTVENDSDVEGIYVMNADGSGQRWLTDNRAFDSDPVFTPDGKKIVFTSRRDGDSEIFIMNADGSNQIQLTNNTVDDTSPTVSRR